MPTVPTSPDPERLPVVVASGQSLERSELVGPVDLMERASESALVDVPGLRDAIQLVSVVNIMSFAGPAPASELAGRIGAAGARCEVTTIGGNSPQWLVNRAAAAIAAGSLEVTLIAGAEAIRSQRGRRAAGLPRPDVGPFLPDPVVGDDLPGVGPAESAIGLLLPVHVYPLFESVVASRAGRDADGHREVMGRILAPFTEVAAVNPYAWFPRARTAGEIATPSPDNRIVSEPYTKLMTAFLGSDQGAALVVCSLAAAQRAGVADRAVFVWSGADSVDVRSVAARPDPGRSPGIEAAGRAALAAASAANGGHGAVGIDDLEVLDVYSCFPSAIELAATALGLSLDDTRGLTVTGGLPYFGGPGNNYTTHGIAEVTDRLRGTATGTRAGTGAGAGDRSGLRLGLTTGLGWFITKHAVGVYGNQPPPGGFTKGDTSTEQAAIDASAVEVALEVDEPTTATVVCATVARDGDGTPTSAPLIARLPDGRHMAVGAADHDTVRSMGTIDVPGLVGESVLVEAGEPRYRLATG
jgi:acetyl-CoA C-acetyltransferase